MSGTIKPICILDDDSSILSSLKELLASDGFEAETCGRPKGSVLTVLFQLDGEEFLALNGGPHFKFSPAISFIANCGTQKEIVIRSRAVRPSSRATCTYSRRSSKST